MKLLVTSDEGDPRDVDHWSGLPHYVSKCLATKFELCFDGNLTTKARWYDNWIRRWYLRTGQGWYAAEYEPSAVKSYADQLKKTIREQRPDAVVALRCNAIAALDIDLPIFFIHDVTLRQLFGYYAPFAGFSKRSHRAAEQMQADALARSAGAIYSSTWASESAIRDYATAPEKVHTIPFGANLDDLPSRDEVFASIDKRLGSPVIRFLFVGVEWERKGGPTLIRIARQLVARGLKLQLDIVGIEPPADVAAESFVVRHGFLSKKDPAQLAKFRSLYTNANFFFTPSESECYGCVFCEANAFGLPVLARDTGGVSEIVKEGVNGYLLSTEKPDELFVETILGLCQDPARYRQMARQARDEYDARLNWDVFAERIEKVIRAAF